MTLSAMNRLLRRNKGREIQQSKSAKAAVNQPLLIDLIGAAEQKIGFHRAFTFDVDAFFHRFVIRCSDEHPIWEQLPCLFLDLVALLK
jgi:hypothetical protein